MSVMPVAVSVQGVSHAFGNRRVLSDVSFDVNIGDVLGFLGPNGAGKSTTMRIVAGFLRPYRGRVSLMGQDVMTSPALWRRKLGYLPEGAPMYEEMTVYNFLGFIAGCHGFSGAQRRARLQHASDLTHLSSVWDMRIEELSKGFKRRVALAAALLHDPHVLVLDEPTDGLDPNQKHDLRSVIRDLSKNKAIIISTHILEEVDAICSRLIILNQGRIVVDTTPEALRQQSVPGSLIHVTLASKYRGRFEENLKKLSYTLEVSHKPTHQEGLLALSVQTQNPDAIKDIREILERERILPHHFSEGQPDLQDIFRRLTA
jgi:ABC-2 type transport system ATP-binding protein